MNRGNILYFFTVPLLLVVLLFALLGAGIARLCSPLIEMQYRLWRRRALKISRLEGHYE